MTKKESLHFIKRNILENLETLRLSLVSCVDEGMVDMDDAYYNELLSLVEDIHVVKTSVELSEAVTRAKGLEADIAAFLARKGRTTVSLDWPDLS